MKKNSIFIFAIGIIFFILIFALRNVAYPKEIVELCGFLFDYAIGIINSVGVLESLFEVYSVYGAVIIIAVTVFIICVGVFMLKVFPKKMAQASASIYCDMGSVIKCGVGFVGINLLLIFAMLNSVVGIVVAMFNIFLLVVVTILGTFSFSTALGSYFQYLYNGDNRSIAINYMIGTLFLSVCSNIYGFREIMWFFILPVFGCGSFVWSVYGIITNRHFDTSLVGVKKEHFDRNKIRDIITRDIE